MASPDVHLLNRARLLQARALIAEWNPFLGHLALQMPVGLHVNGPASTAWVDGLGRCGFDEGFLSALTPSEAASVLLHETLHLALDCFARQGDRDARLWNMAHDLAVNQLIEDSRGHGQPVSWPQGFRPLLHDGFRGMAAEEIYALLWDALKLDRDSDPWPGHPGPASPEVQQDLRDRWGPARIDAAGEVLPKVIDLDLQEGSGATPEQRERLRKKWQEGLLSAAERSMGEKGIGSLPAWAQRLVGPLLQPRVPWQEVLARRIHGHLAGSQRTFVRPGRRSHALGSVLPGRRRSRGLVGVFIDVSGSISSGELEAFLGELQGILATAGCAVRLLTWDVDVGEDLILEGSEELDAILLERGHRIRGGGGTDPRCALDRLLDPASDAPVPSFAVLLTDGYVPWPQAAEWPMDVLVVSTGPLPHEGFGYESLALECP